MWKFAVWNQDAPASDWPLDQAYMLGSDELPVQAELTFRDGWIVAEKPSADAAGLCVLFPVGDARVYLRTCLLPPRPEPYVLALELARHRIMLVLNKLEQWGLFELPPDDPIMALFERARVEFTSALVALRHDGPAVADAIARRALALSIEASERLALLQSDRQIKTRLDRSLFDDASERSQDAGPDRALPEGAVKHPDGVGLVLPQPALLGVAISPNAFGEPLTRVAGSLDFVTVPMRWVDMEPTEGKYAFAKTDRWIEWAVRQAKVGVVAGPLIDFRELCVPEWLYIWEHDYETLRELVYEHVKALVTRYRRTVSRWTVCSGLHVNESFALTLERMMDLTRLCAVLVKKLHPAGKVQVEISRPWGEYHARNKRSMPPKMYADAVAQAGVMVDAYGLRLQLGQPDQGRLTRDLMALSELLDRYAELDRPIAVTAMGVPSQPPAEATHAGAWGGGWTPETQARWLREALAIAAAKPFVVSVCWQDLHDSPEADMPAGGLLTDAGAPKPAAGAIIDLRRAMLARR